MGYVESQVFNNEKIYFNKNGFNHILRKNGRLRTQEEQNNRLELLFYAKGILMNSKKFDTYIKNEKGDKKSLAQFWSFGSKINNKKVRVIVRQINNGPKHFFSIFEEKSR
jgi:hypothetical protein